MRLARAFEDLEVVHINEVAGGVAMAAHLLEFDSVHGRWDLPVSVAEGRLNVAGKSISYSSNQRLQDTRWSDLGVDVVVDCTGKFKSIDTLQPYLEQGVDNVVVSAPWGSVYTRWNSRSKQLSSHPQTCRPDIVILLPWVTMEMSSGL